MKYLVLRLNIVSTYGRARRPFLCSEGYDILSQPAISIDGLMLPADAPQDGDFLAHVGWLQAQSIASDLLGSTLRRIELEDGFTAHEAAQAIFAERIGDPANDVAVYILIPAQVDRSCVLHRGSLYPARRSARIEKAAEQFAERLHGNDEAISAARAAWLDCVEQATHDPNVMQWLIRGDGGCAYAQRAFDAAPYVAEAREAVCRMSEGCR